MTVHFIGAGPGDPDLITVRGRDLIAAAPLVLYAGSLVPPQVVAHAPPGARVIDTAPLTLDAIVALMADADAAGEDVARVHSGDPSLYGAIAEQMRRLSALGIAYDVTPGVPAFAAAAALLATELTLPELSQTVILTRTPGAASPMPPGESLTTLGASGATLAIHLSVRNIHLVVRDLAPLYGEDCPVVVAYRVGWPDQRVIRGTLATIRGQVKAAKITRTALILVGRVLGAEGFAERARRVVTRGADLVAVDQHVVAPDSVDAVRLAVVDLVADDLEVVVISSHADAEPAVAARLVLSHPADVVVADDAVVAAVEDVSEIESLGTDAAGGTVASEARLLDRYVLRVVQADIVGTDPDVHADDTVEEEGPDAPAARGPQVLDGRRSPRAAAEIHIADVSGHADVVAARQIRCDGGGRGDVHRAGRARRLTQRRQAAARRR